MGTTTEYSLQERLYNFYDPGGLPPNAPLVISLHPGGGGPISWQTASPSLHGTLDAAADAKGFYVCYPAGSNRIAGAGYTWHSGWFTVYATQIKVKDLLFIKNLIAKLTSLHSIDPTKIYLNGYSNGAMLALCYVATYPTDIAGACLAAAALSLDPTDCAGTINVPITWVYGSQDTNVPPLGGVSGSARALVMPLADTAAFLRGRGATVNLIELMGATHAFPTIQSVLSSQEHTDFATLMSDMIS